VTFTILDTAKWGVLAAWVTRENDSSPDAHRISGAANKAERRDGENSEINRNQRTKKCISSRNRC